MKLRIILLAILFTVSAFAEELPLLTEPFAVEGINLFPDSTDASLFYYAPSAISLKYTEGEPEFTFQRFRYLGTSALGDMGTFWAKGILSFTIVIDSPVDQLNSARNSLKARGINTPRLRPLPIASTDSVLIYHLAQGSEDDQGLIAGGEMTDDLSSNTNAWLKKSFTVELDALSTDLLWQAYQQGNVVLSLGVSVHVTGLNGRRKKNMPEPELITQTVFSDALRVEVSPSRHPQLFQTTDIDAKMPAGYTYLTVFCHDFAEDYQVDHVRVLVEVRGIAVDGDTPQTQVEFSEATPANTRQEIHFEFAMNLDAGYLYRVTTINSRGELGQGEWQTVELWSGNLDVSLRQEKEGSTAIKKLDPRDLY